jgi:hypothetical protein
MNECHCRGCEGLGPVETSEHLAECTCDDCHGWHKAFKDASFCNRCQNELFEEIE